MQQSEEREDKLRAQSAPAEASTFVQPKIAGYRQLNATEAALMNEVKNLEVECAKLVNQLRQHQDISAPPPLGDALPPVDQRAVSIAVTEMQTAFMWLTRSIARPANPFQR